MEPCTWAKEGMRDQEQLLTCSGWILSTYWPTLSTATSSLSVSAGAVQMKVQVQVQVQFQSYQ